MCVSMMLTCSSIISTAGCKSHPALERTIHDTVRVDRTVTVRDTVLKTEPVTVTSYLSIPCPDMVVTPIVKQQKHAKLTIKQVGQILGVECLCDTASIKAQLRDTYEKEYHARWMEQTKTVTKETKYIPWWAKFLLWSGVLFWIIIIIVLIKKFYLKK